MLTSITLQDRPREFLAATGLTHAECVRLLPAFPAAYATWYPSIKTWQGQVRQRQVGGGANGVVPQRADKLCFLLVSQQTHPLPTMHGWPCGLRQLQTHDWMHPLLPVWQRAFAELGMAPARDASQGAPSHLTLEGAPKRAMAGTEHRRQRPQDATAQQASSSGKKKAHTAKHLRLVNAMTSTVVYLGPTEPGNIPEKQATAQVPLASPVHAPLDKDTGLQG
jgi:hypothetical protein